MDSLPLPVGGTGASRWRPGGETGRRRAEPTHLKQRDADPKLCKDACQAPYVNGMCPSQFWKGAGVCKIGEGQAKETRPMLQDVLRTLLASSPEERTQDHLWRSILSSGNDNRMIIPVQRSRPQVDNFNLWKDALCGVR
jgi:hypothetical protein